MLGNGNDIDSNDDLSDDGLDYSQKFADNPINSNSTEPNDEAFIEANVKLQSTIDKVLNKLEEFSNQFPESQVQLIMKLEESQKSQSELRAKFETVESHFKEDLSELQLKIDNLEGLINAYELEKQDQVKKLESLGEELVETRRKLENAESQIENGKAEVSNLHAVSHGLKAQCNKLTSELQDNDFKGTQLSINLSIYLN